jgi:hypothetical protein
VRVFYGCVAREARWWGSSAVVGRRDGGGGSGGEGAGGGLKDTTALRRGLNGDDAALELGWGGRGD